MEKLLKINDVCDLLQVSRSLVYKWVHYNYIPYVKMGSLIRFRNDEILQWIKKRSKKGRATIKEILEL